MTLKQFREHKYLPTQLAKEFRTNGIFQLALETLADNHPDKFAFNGDDHGDISPTRAAIALGESRGYTQCLDRFKLLALPIHKENKELGDTTYEKEIEETGQS